MSDVIERALTLVDQSPAPNMSDAQIDTLVKRLRSEKKAMIGFEQDAADELGRQIEALERQKKANSDGFAGYKKFATLDMLKWRDKNGYPKLALFNLDSPVFAIDSSWAHNETPLPFALKALYEDVRATLRRKANKPWSSAYYYTLSCKYGGVIPQETRDRIAQAKKQFQSVHIMAEPQKWELSKTPAPLFDMDPLVVGWDGHDLWLVDKFELTSLERLIASEFVEE